MKMSKRVKRVAAALGMLGMGGYLFSGPGTGCTNFTIESAFVATNFCFIFDCQNGILGGTVDTCSGVGSGDDTVEGNDGLPLFRDCPSTGGP